jgi:hypothetical protein
MSAAEDTALASDGVVHRGTLARGTLAGVVAWLLGYLVAYVWKADAVSESLRGVGFVSQLLGGEAIPAWKSVSWLFLNAHFVDTRFPTVAGGTRTTNFVTGEGGSTLLLVLPPLVLAVAGLAITYGHRGSLTDRATAGATVALGYLPLSVLVALVGTHTIGATEATIAPDLVTAVLLAGVVYPAVFGALGGVASSVLE